MVKVKIFVSYEEEQCIKVNEEGLFIKEIKYGFKVQENRIDLHNT